MFQCKVFSVNAPATQVTFYLGLPDLNWVEQIEYRGLRKTQLLSEKLSLPITRI